MRKAKYQCQLKEKYSFKKYTKEHLEVVKSFSNPAEKSMNTVHTGGQAFFFKKLSMLVFILKRLIVKLGGEDATHGEVQSIRGMDSHRMWVRQKMLHTE